MTYRTFSGAKPITDSLKCTFANQVKSLQRQADAGGDPVAISRQAKAISADLSSHQGWDDTSWGVWGCAWPTATNLQQQLGALLTLGMAKTSKEEAEAETRREHGIRTGVDIAENVHLQQSAEFVRKKTEREGDLGPLLTDLEFQTNILKDAASRAAANPFKAACKQKYGIIGYMCDEEGGLSFTKIALAVGGVLLVGAAAKVFVSKLAERAADRIVD